MANRRAHPGLGKVIEKLLLDPKSPARQAYLGLALALEEGREALAEARQEIAILTERTRQQDSRIEALRADLDTERHIRQAAEGSAAELKAENARLQERAGYLDELRAQINALQDHFTVPVNQNQPEASAKISKTRKRGGQPAE